MVSANTFLFLLIFWCFLKRSSGLRKGTTKWLSISANEEPKVAQLERAQDRVCKLKPV